MLQSKELGLILINGSIPRPFTYYMGEQESTGTWQWEPINLEEEKPVDLGDQKGKANVYDADVAWLWIQNIEKFQKNFIKTKSF